jgi:hypothetical protein
MHKDRRTSDRVTPDRPLALQLTDEGVDATLRNISLAGVSCHCSVPFEEMTEMLVSLSLPPLPGAEDPGSIEARGAVVRCRPMRHGTARRRYEVAIYFTELGDESRKTLQAFLEARLDFTPAS